MEYNGWKKLDKVSIVYSDASESSLNYIEYKGKLYPKAYITEYGTSKAHQKSLDVAIRYAHSSKSSPIIVTTDNTEFNLQIVSASNGASYAGKLNFWMCIMSKPGVEPFAVGINSDLLADIIIESTVVNGEFKEKVSFARKFGHLGVIHTNMDSYVELNNDQELKKKMSTGKTTKWKIGYEYKTVTTSSVMLGHFNPIASYSDDEYYYYGPRPHESELILNFNAKSKPFYTIFSKSSSIPDKMHDLFRQSGNLSLSKCPSRSEGNKVFDVDDNYYQSFCNEIVRHYSTDPSRYNYRNVVTTAFALFNHSPESTIKLLTIARDFRAKVIYNTANGIRDDYNKGYYDNYDKSNFTLDKVVFRREKIGHLYITYNNTREDFYRDVVGYYNRLIEIANIEKEKK